jgi:hypothetical protein
LGKFGIPGVKLDPRNYLRYTAARSDLLNEINENDGSEVYAKDPDGGGYATISEAFRMINPGSWTEISSLYLALSIALLNSSSGRVVTRTRSEQPEYLIRTDPFNVYSL